MKWKSFIFLLALINLSGCKKTDKTAYKVGQNGEANGLIFYDKGKKIDGWQYLEAVLPLSEIIIAKKWSSDSNNISGTSEEIGTGLSNTQKIIQLDPSKNWAAYLCDQLNINGFSDWFLPQKVK